ncbi:MAG: TrmB family transcriptional regulator, partial [Proteobacteria bacterium]|nr:TrmB family transcriptional regulator [Pseudomonadota bacterium]
MELAKRMPEGAAGATELTEALQQLGFTDYEAKAYVALTQAYPATAYEVAKLSGLPRANVYSVLRQLEMKAAIQPVSENPIRYAPRDPEEFFGLYARHTSALCQQVARQVKSQSRADENTYVWYHRGEDEVRAKVGTLIAEARESVWIKASDHLIRPYLPALKEAAKRGVQVILVIFGSDPAPLKVHPRMTVFLHEGDGMLRGAADVLFTISTDFADVMIATHHPRLGVSASYARNRSIIYVVQTLFLHEFYFAEMYAKIGPTLDAAFGKGL